MLEAMQQNGQDKNPAAWYYLGRIYLTAGRSVPGGYRAHEGGAARAGLRQGHRQLSPERLGRAGQGGQQVRGRQERRLRPRAVPAGGRDLSRLADRVLPDRRDHERQGTARQRGVLLRPGGRPSASPPTRPTSRSATGRRSTRARCCSTARSTTGRRASSSSTSSGCPNDNEAKRGLAAAYRGSGKIEQAQAIEKELVAAGGAPAGGRRAQAAGPASQDLMSVGVNRTTTRSTPMPRRRSRRWWRRSPTIATRCRTSAIPISR